MTIRYGKCFFSSTVVEKSAIEERNGSSLFGPVKVDPVDVSISVREFLIPNFDLRDCPRCIDSYCVLFMLLLPGELCLKHLSLKNICKFQLYSRQETIVALCLVNDFSDFDILAFGDSLKFGKLAVVWIYVRPLYWRRRIRQKMDDLIRTTLFHTKFH